MKKNLYFLALAGLLTLGACQDDLTQLSSTVVNGQVQYTLATPQNADKVFEVTLETLKDSMTTLTASTPDYGSQLAATYSLEASLREDFKEAVALTVSSSTTTIQLTNEVVNNALNGFYNLGKLSGFDYPIPMYFRMKSVLSEATNNPLEQEQMVAPSYSNSIKLQVKGMEIVSMPNLYYLVGSFGGWGTNLGQDLIPLSPIVDYKYILNNGKGEFKHKSYFKEGTMFKLKADVVEWNPQWGSSDGSLGAAQFKPTGSDPEPTNFVAPADGVYELNLNTVTNKLTVAEVAEYELPTYEYIDMVGSFNDWGSITPEKYKMLPQSEDNPYVVYLDVEFESDCEVKFRTDGDWSKPNWGGKSFPYKIAGAGENIKAKAGKYRVVFNVLDGSYFFFEQ